MKCKFCGKQMRLDDTDFNFKGNFDRYWVCECGASAFERVRYGITYDVCYERGEK